MSSHLIEWPPAMHESTYTPRAVDGFAPTVEEVWRNLDAAVLDLANPGVDSVLLLRQWAFEEDRFEFEHLEVYEQVAHVADYELRECTRPWNLGTEHLLFLVKDRQLGNEELMSSSS